MLTADFLLPSSTPIGSTGPVLRNTIRVWNYRWRQVTDTIRVLTPDNTRAGGVMDVKFLPRDPNGIAYTAGMFDGYIYMLDPKYGTAIPAFDCTTVVPHVERQVRGRMGQIMAVPDSGDGLIFSRFEAARLACSTPQIGRT